MRPEDKFVTPEQLAEKLQLDSHRTVLKYAREAGLRCLRFGNKVRFDPDEVARWLQARGGSR